MIKIAGHWELSWNTPIMEAQLWNFPLRDFDILDWYMWPISGIRHNERTVNLHEYASLKEILALEEMKGLDRVFLEPINPKFPHEELDLRTFKHPKNVLYIFGSNHFNPIIHHKREQDRSVTIPTIHNKGVLWPHQCMVMVFYDRLIKEQW